MSQFVWSDNVCFFLLLLLLLLFRLLLLATDIYFFRFSFFLLISNVQIFDKLARLEENILEVCVLQTDMQKYIHSHSTCTFMHIMHIQSLADCKSFARPSPARVSGRIAETWRHVNAIYVCIYHTVYVCVCVYAKCSYVCICVWQPCTCCTGTRYKFVHKHFVEITIKNMFKHRQKTSKLHL